MPLCAAILDPSLVRDYSAEAGCHSHDHSQVLFSLTGALQMEVEGHAALVDTACGLVVPAGAIHSYRAVQRARVLVLDCQSGPGTDRFRRFAMPVGWRALSQHGLLAALEAAPTLQNRRRLDVAALTESIDVRLAHRWTVAELAEMCHLSPQRFRARFAELTGMAPLEFVRSRRLDRAEQLLRRGWSLQTTALQVGYNSASALSFAMHRDRDTGARRLRRGESRAFLES